MISCKKAQLTPIILVGIVIVSAIIGIIALQDTLFKKSYDPEVIVFREEVLDCFNNDFSRLVSVQGIQGGYYDTTLLDEDSYLLILPGFFPYYYSEGESFLPSLSTIESEFARGAEESITYCLNSLESENFTLSYDSVISEVKIHNTEIEIVPVVKVTYFYNDTSIILDFSEESIFINSEFFAMYELTEIIVGQALATPEEWIDLTELHSEARLRDLNISILDIEEEPETYLFSIEQNRPDVYPSRLIFLNKYNLEEINFPSSVN